MKRRYAILDRDGTIIEDKHYLADPAGVELLPGAAPGLARMSALGLGLIVVTNQSGIGRGYFRADDMHRVNARLCELLLESGVRIDDVLHCPHAPDDDCLCRKPGTRLVLEAAERMGFDPGGCFVVGDKPCDLELGRNLGAVPILVTTGKGAATRDESGAEHVCDDLEAAAGIMERLLATG